MPEVADPPVSESLGWRAGLPGDLQKDETFKQFKTVGDFAKHHLEVAAKVPELEGKLKDYVPKLPDDASDADRNLYYEALGRPKTAQEYQIEGEDKNAPEWNSSYKQAFHSAGLTTSQAAQIGKWWNGQVQKMVEAHNTSITNEIAAAETRLKSEWGDKFDTNVELAKRLYQKYGEGEFDEAFNRGSSANRFSVIRMLVKFASLTGEDRSPQGGHSAGKPNGALAYDKSKMPPARART
jgi:hypothetical protein